MVTLADVGRLRIHSRCALEDITDIHMCIFKMPSEAASKQQSFRNTVKLLEIWNFIKKAKKKTHLWISLGLPAKVL